MTFGRLSISLERNPLYLVFESARYLYIPQMPESLKSWMIGASDTSAILIFIFTLLTFLSRYDLAFCWMT